MSNLDPLLERNRAHAESGTHQGLTPVPNHQVLVVSCMDGRIDPAHILGVGPGDALVLRNAGGRVTDEVEHEVAFIGAITDFMFGEDAPQFEVAVVHHTECGTAMLADDTFRSRYAALIDTDEATLTEQAVVDPYETVAVDVKRLRAARSLPSRAVVSGHVYDVGTGAIKTVEPAPVRAG